VVGVGGSQARGGLAILYLSVDLAPVSFIVHKGGWVGDSSGTRQRLQASTGLPIPFMPVDLAPSIWLGDNAQV
jgi:hypothetical protein